MRTIKQVLALLALVIGVSSCASILGTSKDLLMSVEKGMTKKEVTSLLGTPDYRRFGQDMEEWEFVKAIAGNAGGTVIIIGFVDGRVINMDSYHDNSYSKPPIVVGTQVDVEMNNRGMRERDFQAFYDKVKSRPFKDDQLEILGVGIANKEFTCRQCVRMMSIYTFDDDKLKVLQIIAPNIIDRENYEEIINALDYLSSYEKAKKMLGVQK